MSEINDKFSEFSKEVIKQAEAKRDEIMKTISQSKDAVLGDARQRYENDAKNYISAKKSEARSKINQEISKRTLDNRKKLLKRRNEIVNEIMDKVRDKILDFTNSPEYLPYLISIIEKNKRYIIPNETIINLSVRDFENISRIKKEIENTCGLDASGLIFKKSEDILLGGTIIESKAQKIIIHETFDSRLSEQNEFFAQISNLSLG